MRAKSIVQPAETEKLICSIGPRTITRTLTVRNGVGGELRGEGGGGEADTTGAGGGGFAADAVAIATGAAAGLASCAPDDEPTVGVVAAGGGLAKEVAPAGGVVAPGGTVDAVGATTAGAVGRVLGRAELVIEGVVAVADADDVIGGPAATDGAAT